MWRVNGSRSPSRVGGVLEGCTSACRNRRPILPMKQADVAIDLQQVSCMPLKCDKREHCSVALLSSFNRKLIAPSTNSTVNSFCEWRYLNKTILFGGALIVEFIKLMQHNRNAADDRQQLRNSPTNSLTACLAVGPSASEREEEQEADCPTECPSFSCDNHRPPVHYSFVSSAAGCRPSSRPPVIDFRPLAYHLMSTPPLQR